MFAFSFKTVAGSYLPIWGDVHCPFVRWFVCLLTWRECLCVVHWLDLSWFLSCLHFISSFFFSIIIHCAICAWVRFTWPYTGLFDIFWSTFCLRRKMNCLPSWLLCLYEWSVDKREKVRKLTDFVTEAGERTENGALLSDSGLAAILSLLSVCCWLLRCLFLHVPSFDILADPSIGLATLSIESQSSLWPLFSALILLSLSSTCSLKPYLWTFSQ